VKGTNLNFERQLLEGDARLKLRRNLKMFMLMQRVKREREALI
jgi:hypothetical protein